MEIDIANIISAAGTLLAAYFAYNQYTKNKLTDLKVEYFKKEEERSPSEISLYYDHAPYSFGFTQHYPDGRTGIVGGLLYHGIPDRSFAVTLQPFHGWQIHT